jgi:hypothetical protein
MSIATSQQSTEFIRRPFVQGTKCQAPQRNAPEGSRHGMGVAAQRTLATTRRETRAPARNGRFGQWENGPSLPSAHQPPRTAARIHQRKARYHPKNALRERAPSAYVLATGGRARVRRAHRGGGQQADQPLRQESTDSNT